MQFNAVSVEEIRMDAERATNTWGVDWKHRD